MEFRDEEILKAKRDLEEFDRARFSEDTIKEELEQSIYDGVMRINEVPVQFSERDVLDGKAAIWMPTDFRAMTAEEITINYQWGNRPQSGYGNAYLPLSIVFNHTEHKIPNALMGDFRKVVRQLFDRAGPKVGFLPDESFVSGSHNISVLSFTSGTIDTTIYNKMFFSSVEDRVVIGSINFETKHMQRYVKIAEEIVHSYRIIGDEEVTS